MTVVGVICEYNPFHLGHEKQLRLIRERFGPDAAVVCLMSGSYVQRGAPAIFDKRTRAAAAVEAGADLVLELPVTAVLSSAEGFARGGAEALDRLGIADALCFGCESGDGARLADTASILCQPECTAALQGFLSDGESYPAARQHALEALGGDGSLLCSPNDILAVEYCKALIERGSRIEPFAIRREGDYHAQSPDPENPSASAVRALLESGADWRQLVPSCAETFYVNALCHTMRAGERAMLARLRSLSPEDWARVAHGGEGLWSKAMKAARSAGSMEELLCALKSKRYPRTRLQRLLLCAYLGIRQEELGQPLPYLRVLAFDQTGALLLRQAKKNGGIPLVNAGERPENAAYYELECRAARLCSLFAEGEIPDESEENVRVYRKAL